MNFRKFTHQVQKKLAFAGILLFVTSILRKPVSIPVRKSDRPASELRNLVSQIWWGGMRNIRETRFLGLSCGFTRTIAKETGIL
jgi:hypothetical protein